MEDVTTQNTEVSVESAAVTAPEVIQEPSLDKVEKALNEMDAPPTDVSVVGDVKPQEAAIPVYQPDFKYKAAGEERELDARLHGVVKSKEDEEWLKTVFKKADGIEQIQTQRDEYRTSYQNLATQAEAILHAADKQDFKTVFQSLGIQPDVRSVMRGLGVAKKDILEYAIELAQLTPEQESAYAKQYQLEQENKNLSVEREHYQHAVQEMKVQTRTVELNNALSTPDIAPIVKAFDEHHGQGAFWDEVVKRGQMYFYSKKVDMPVQQLVSEVSRLARGYAQAPQSAQVQAPAQAQAIPAKAKSPEQLPVIPTVGSNANAPTKKAIRSLKDLERAVQEEM